MAAENAQIEDGDTVAVWGCGPVGQFAIRSALMMGAGRVIAIDEVPERLAMAEAGCAETIDFSETDVYDELMKRTDNRGPDSCIDAVGCEDVHRRNRRHRQAWLGRRMGNLLEFASSIARSNLLDGAAKSSGVIVVGATNRPAMIDPAIVRVRKAGEAHHYPKTRHDGADRNPAASFERRSRLRRRQCPRAVVGHGSRAEIRGSAAHPDTSSMSDTTDKGACRC